MSSVRPSRSAADVVVIGGSAGGMTALKGIFQAFVNTGDSVVVVVLHRAPQDSPLAEVLQMHTRIPILEPADSPWTPPAGVVTLAPAGYHLLLGNTRTAVAEPQTPITVYENGSGVRTHLTLDPPVLYSRPSLDVTFSSAAGLVNPVTAVLLSCASEDGAGGCAAVKASGGRVILQAPVSCEVPTAVDAAMHRVAPDLVADPQGIGRWLSTHVGQGR